MKVTLTTDQEFYSPGCFLVCQGGEFETDELVPVYRRDDLEKTPWVQFTAGYIMYGRDYGLPAASEKTDRAILYDELTDDPLDRSYSQKTAEEILTSLNTKDRSMGMRFISARTLLAELDPVVAATIYQKFKAGAESNPVLGMAMDMLTTYSDGGGIDICHPNTLAFIDTLVPALLTQDEANYLKSLAYTSRAIELIGRAAISEEVTALKDLLFPAS